ncbi:MAG TPA: hypothetical protein VF555_16600 [Variovorax sp.]
MYTPYKPGQALNPTRADILADDADLAGERRAQFWARMHRLVEAGEMVFVPEHRSGHIGTLIRPAGLPD